MATSFRRFRSGEKFRINEHTANAMMAAAEEYSRRSRDPGLIGSPEYFFQGNTIHVRNDSGSDMPRFSVAGLAAALITPAQNIVEFQNYPRFSVRTPVVATDASRFCILIEPLADGAIGLAMVSGVVPVQINGAALPGLNCAGVVDGQIGYLTPAACGVDVLWCDGGSSLRWALVQIPGTAPTVLRGTLANTLLGSDAYGQVNILLPDDSSAARGPYNALNAYYEAGSAADICLLIANTQASTRAAKPYTILRVVPVAMTSYQPGYDGNGNWTAIAQNFYGAGAAAAGSAVPYATGATAGSDLQRDATTIGLSLSSSSITYGTLINMTATVAHSTGSGDPTGTVYFYDGLTTALLGSASVGSSGVATLSNVLFPGNASTYPTFAVYSGDAAYNTSTSSAANLTVAKHSTSVSLASSPSTSTYGDSITLTATITMSVTPGPTGLVTFSQGATTLNQARLTYIGSNIYQATIAVSSLAAGSLTLTAAYAGDGNFSSSSGTCSQTVNKAPLTVTAQNATQIYGDSVPAFAAVYSGFVLGDTAGVLSGSPSLSTTATSASPAGSYTITAAAGSLSASNYTVPPVNGTLTIQPAPLVATGTNWSMAHGAPLPALTGTVTGIKNADTLTFSGSTVATSSSSVGNYTITAAVNDPGSKLANYNLTTIDGILTII